MLTIEEKIADIIRENDVDTAAKVLYTIMQDCVTSEVVTTTANIYRAVDKAVDMAQYHRPRIKPRS